MKTVLSSSICSFLQFFLHFTRNCGNSTSPLACAAILAKQKLQCRKFATITLTRPHIKTVQITSTIHSSCFRVYIYLQLRKSTLALQNFLGNKTDANKGKYIYKIDCKCILLLQFIVTT